MPPDQVYRLMKTLDSISWGIIGCGDVTEVKSGPPLQQIEDSQLVAVMRRNAAKAEDYARRHSVPRWYSDADALIEDPSVNAVYIATPPASHKEYTLRVAAAGKPVLVEKPMALTVEECDEMIDACERAEVPLFVAYYRRSLPRFEKMRALIQGGAIGEPRAIVVRQFKRQEKLPNQGWKVDPTINGGGFFVDMQSHTLDWMDYVFGPALQVTGLATNQARIYDAEDTVGFSLMFDGGVVGSGMCSYNGAAEEESVTVYGTEGEVSMGFFRASPILLVSNGENQVIQMPDPPHVHRPFIETVVSHLKGGRECPSTGVSALRTTRAIETILNS